MAELEYAMPTLHHIVEIICLVRVMMIDLGPDRWPKALVNQTNTRLNSLGNSNSKAI